LTGESARKSRKTVNSRQQTVNYRHYKYLAERKEIIKNRERAVNTVNTPYSF